MEDAQRDAIARLCREDPARDRTICLEIPDGYPYLDAETVRMMEERVAPHVSAR